MREIPGGVEGIHEDLLLASERIGELHRQRERHGVASRRRGEPGACHRAAAVRRVASFRATPGHTHVSDASPVSEWSTRFMEFARVE